jgi:hypothetical protein
MNRAYTITIGECVVLSQQSLKLPSSVTVTVTVTRSSEAARWTGRGIGGRSNLFCVLL